MTTQEGNELIALFMGYKLGWWIPGEKQVKQYLSPNDKALYLKDFKYHCSWNWLMPVVEKIESLELTYSNRPYFPRVELINKVCVIELRTETLAFPGKSKIEATWTTVIEFIKWYNEEKTKVECRRCGRLFPKREINTWNGKCRDCNFVTADEERVKVIYGI